MLKFKLQLFSEDPEDPDKGVEDLKLKQIEELRLRLENAVSKEDYEKLKKEYETLLNDFVNKRPVQTEKSKVSFKEAKDAFVKVIESGNSSEKDFFEKGLQYRDAFIEEFGVDPSTDTVHKKGQAILPSKETKQTKAIADALKSMLESSETDQDFEYKIKKEIN